ncbi:MAG: lysoplasmalogenase [Rhodococcus sp. (in: high G+C Gram-positive bacteria)]
MHAADWAYGVAAAATVAGALTHRPVVQYLSKPLLMPILAARSSADMPPQLAVGLAAATVGDLAMIDPDDDRRFTVGASSFAVMQACWSVLLVQRGSRFRARHVLPRAIGWAVGGAVAARRSPSIAPVSIAYGAALGAMSALGADGDTRAVIGSTLFTVSDAMVLARRQVSDEAVRTALEAAVLMTYIGAQHFLVQSLRAA